jgi:hypothetical protein
MMNKSILKIIMITLLPLIVFAGNSTTIKLPDALTTGADLACERAVIYIDDFFKQNTEIDEIHFTNDWTPFPNPLNKKWFYINFSDFFVD